MKPRHAAALALVGWYLMVPPFQDDLRPGEFRARLDAPLYQWELLPGSWNSADDCNQQAQRNDKLYLAAKRRSDYWEIDRLAKTAGFTGADRKIFGLWMDQAYSHAVCVPTNDPRLNRFIPIYLN